LIEKSAYRDVLDLDEHGLAVDSIEQKYQKLSDNVVKILEWVSFNRLLFVLKKLKIVTIQLEIFDGL
jgi:hypothetical protein